MPDGGETVSRPPISARVIFGQNRSLWADEVTSSLGFCTPPLIWDKLMRPNKLASDRRDKSSAQTGKRQDRKPTGDGAPSSSCSAVSSSRHWPSSRTRPILLTLSADSARCCAALRSLVSDDRPPPPPPHRMHGVAVLMIRSTTDLLICMSVKRGKYLGTCLCTDFVPALTWGRQVVCGSHQRGVDTGLVAD